MARVRTSEQPHRSILRRWRENGNQWVDLDVCGHTEPGTGLDFADSVRCQQCNPVRKPDAPPLPAHDPFAPTPPRRPAL